jgi:hypothetical protein
VIFTDWEDEDGGDADDAEEEVCAGAMGAAEDDGTDAAEELDAGIGYEADCG